MLVYQRKILQNEIMFQQPRFPCSANLGATEIKGIFRDDLLESGRVTTVSWLTVEAPTSPTVKAFLAEVFFGMIRVFFFERTSHMAGMGNLDKWKRVHNLLMYTPKN